MESLIAAIAVGVIVGGVSTRIGHRFEREKRRELRQEERDRDLRQMIEAMMRLARINSSGLTDYSMSAGVPQNLEQARLRQQSYVREFDARNPSFRWAPHRIKDEQLRKLVSDLQSANTDAAVLMRNLLDGWRYSSVEEWDSVAQKTIHRIDDVMERLDQRLDELEW
jgi:hypothetical protein